MLTEKQIDKINNILEKKVFNYNGPIVSGAPNNGDIDYKINLLGYKKMMSVGEYYNYLKISVNIIGLNNQISKLVFGWFDKPYGSMSPKDWAEMLKNNFYQFKLHLESEIRAIISIFDNESNRIIIDDFNITAPKTETLTEGKMSRIAVREIVRDVIKKVKEKKKGFFYLPDNENEVYSFSNLPFQVSLELTLKLDRKMDGYKTTGFYSPEDDVIEMIIIFNPNKIDKQMYELVGEVNEIIAHELEHAYQEYYGEFDRDYEDEIEDPYEYYTQEHEIPAQYKGFRRLSRLRKEPLLMTAKNWFKTHKDIHGLSDDETEKVIEKIMNYKP